MLKAATSQVYTEGDMRFKALRRIATHRNYNLNKTCHSVTYNASTFASNFFCSVDSLRTGTVGIPFPVVTSTACIALDIVAGRDACGSSSYRLMRDGCLLLLPPPRRPARSQPSRDCFLRPGPSPRWETNTMAAVQSLLSVERVHVLGSCRWRM